MQAFRAAHTIKGICLNLGFDKLYQASSDITEQLRGKDTVEGTEERFLEVKNSTPILRIPSGRWQWMSKLLSIAELIFTQDQKHEIEFGKKAGMDVSVQNGRCQ